MELFKSGPEPLDPVARSILMAFDRLGLSRLTAADLASPAEGAPAAEAALSSLLRTGYLRENLGAFERTEAGRLEVAGLETLTILSRPGCHLCQEATAQLTPIARRYDLRLRTVDIDTDAVLRTRFNTLIPVVFLGSRELVRHPIDVRHVQAELSRFRSRG